METSYIYWKHTLPCGVRIEEITGREDKSGKLWLEMARQVWSENGKDGYQSLTHTEEGAPLFDGPDSRRVSVSHTDRLLVVATLPKTSEVDLTHFSPRAAMGVDAERTDRAQVLKIRERFLSEEELVMVAENDVKENILAWTIKEAAYKAALTPGMDIRKDISIKRLPNPTTGAEGMVRIRLADNSEHELTLYSYVSDDIYMITVAVSPKAAKYHQG